MATAGDNLGVDATLLARPPVEKSGSCSISQTLTAAAMPADSALPAGVPKLFMLVRREYAF